MNLGYVFLIASLLAILRTEVKELSIGGLVPSNPGLIGQLIVSGYKANEGKGNDRKKGSSLTDKDTMREEKFNIGDRGSFVYQGTTYTWQVMNDGKKWLTINLNVKVENSWCYNNDPNNSAKYGRLYTWEAAKEACLVLGYNWRLPSDEDWKKLALEYGGYHDWKTGIDTGSPIEAYHALTVKGNSGFLGRLGGWRDPGGSFDYLGDNGIFWSSSLRDTSDARGFGFYRGSRKMSRGNGDCSFGHSVRCVSP